MAARTVDKMRATLPGGNIGSYQITGLRSRLLERLGIVESALREAVANAASDDAVARWIAAHSETGRYAEINAALDPEFVARYPVARRLAPGASRLDLLIEDDKEAFP
jgi:hypothetical protein